jgi:hypothetical protein
MLNAPSLYLSLTLTGKLYGFLLNAQREAEALRERLTEEYYRLNPMPEEARTSFLARVRFEITLSQAVHEQIMTQIVYRITD